MFALSSRLISAAAVTAVLFLISAEAEPSFKLIEKFDLEKFQKQTWWVTHRAQRLRPGHLDRCLKVTISRPFRSNQLYIGIDHENSGVIDQAYFPVEFNSQGFTFRMEDNEVARVDVVDTDYTTYFIGYMSFEKRQDEFLFTYSNMPKPEGALLSKMSDSLLEIAGIGIDALEPVDNDDCSDAEG
ncbi:uncharacterized protein LOC111261805 [Varroa jacobsoni]|uniref:Lipocalin/cytosolic fatty-acid binding domain-containing protein n=1 Tax=Varroa destructor TaxID=109461 RepID=A0A7M7KW51_VARDE|nr:uncharacterized protein LOC111254731 [Varroa destructor]XP_022691339.1 uncharacterized protein LOC111261805 [Varroa jacobsoni]XP_022691340.1 uncharacterized protein LOC111261805 [Varroa jacobsoni]